MANVLYTFIDLECEKCKSKYQITLDNYKRRTRNDTPNLCSSCMKQYADDKRKNSFNKLSDEEKKIFIEKRNWYSKLSDQEKAVHSQRTKDQLASRTKEEQEAINKKNSEGLKKHWMTISDKDKQKRTQGMREGNKKYWESLTPKQRAEKAKQWMKNMTPEELTQHMEILSKRMTEYNDSISLEEKQRRAKNMQRWHENLTDDQKKELYRKTHQWYHELSYEEKINYAISKREWYDNLSEEEKVKVTKKKLAASGNINNLNKRFEDTFNSWHLVNDYYFKSEEMLYFETAHSWDYGIYDKSTNELVMVVDLDGSYFHADECDYDGLHSKEEYDERRSLSIPSNSNIKHFIIQEKNFSKCFKLMIKTLMMNYDEYVNEMFKVFRSMPFPNPKYSDIELVKSYDKLVSMKTNDKYHKNISLNTRIGDRLIQHFHESIYQAKRKGSISPYEAWYDDKLLRECIENRTIYQTYLNPNKILHGFNVSKVAQKVSVFSAGRAKMLIDRYLSEFNEVFDPFSGFSGRMLGAVSLGKRYIGQDISDIHINESNNIIQFLQEYRFDINISISQSDIFKSTGEYECLFTCPPYEDIEQWLDVPVSKYTCDDWIDECLSRFKCKKYLFVVDYTEKYIHNVVDEITNRSHFGSNSEYVILIER